MEKVRGRFGTGLASGFNAGPGDGLVMQKLVPLHELEVIGRAPDLLPEISEIPAKTSAAVTSATALV